MVVDAVVSKQMPGMRLIFLFDMGVAVFFVWSGACKEYRFRPVFEEIEHVVVNKLRAVVAVKGKRLKRQVSFDVVYLRYDVGRGLVPNGPALRPLRADIGHGKAPDELPGQAIAAMGDRVGLQIPRSVDIPVCGSYGYLAAQQRPRP